MYLTVQEFKNAPTALDCSMIIPGGTQAQNDAELTNVIRRASSWVNQICKMPTLEATSNTETKEVTMNNSGLIRIHPDMMPIITLLDSVQYKVSPVSSWISLPLSYIQVFDRYFTVYNLNTTAISPTLAQQFPAFGYYTPYQMRNLQRIPLTIQYTYVNGYPNTLLSANVIAGASTITVKNASGMVGQKLTIYDNDLTEDVYILSVTGNAVTLTAPVLFSHNSGVAVSALPDSVKQATVLLTAFLIKQRGSLAVSMGETTIQGISRDQGSSDVNTAKEMLRPLIRGVVS